ncbi:MAG: nucleotidyltransferase family protein [Defluviitaleaceae bacterium]|nr:nucleotidyltransferase family protein [Defluviitaleaceae bacterium]
MDKYHCAGVIVELNPLHNGHYTHIQETKRITGRDYIVAVMSGNFVQRGEPAIIDKWARTQMALQAGADIVIELPLPYVLGGADYFARGAVQLLADTGIVDCLCFGSESGDAEAIKTGAQILATEPPIYKEALRKSLDAGNSFAAARGAALEAAIQGIRGTSLPPSLTTQPNNGLGMEYCKALALLGNPMEVFTTHRTAGGPSATAIRKALRTHGIDTPEVRDHMPAFAYEILRATHNATGILSLDAFSDIFRYAINKMDALALDEGLHNRLRNFSVHHKTLTDILQAAKTKRYTYTRLARAAMRILLGITPPQSDPPYIRIMGFHQRGAHLLGAIIQHARIPVYTHGANLPHPPAMLAKEWEAGTLYRLLQPNPAKKCERTTPIVRV